MAGIKNGRFRSARQKCYRYKVNTESNLPKSAYGLSHNTLSATLLTYDRSVRPTHFTKLSYLQACMSIKDLYKPEYSRQIQFIFTPIIKGKFNIRE